MINKIKVLVITLIGFNFYYSCTIKNYLNQNIKVLKIRSIHTDTTSKQYWHLIGQVNADIDVIPLPNAHIINHTSEIKTVSDFDGKFDILVRIGDTLSISHKFMKTINLSVKDQLKVKFILKEDQRALLKHYYKPTSYNYKSGIRQIEKTERQSLRKAERLAKREAIRSGEQERTAMGKFFYGIKRLFSKK